MLRKITVLILLCSFVYASEYLAYSADEKSGLSTLFSSKKAELMQDIFVKFDLGSALVILNDDFANDFSKNSPKRLNPDKTLVTLSYRF